MRGASCTAKRCWVWPARWETRMLIACFASAREDGMQRLVVMSERSRLLTPAICILGDITT